MTQENKELLLKDLSARSPYGVRVNVAPVPQEEYKYQSFNAKVVWVGVNHTGVLSDKGFFFQQDVTEIKPYLYPLTSMTEEQFNELEKLGYLKNCAHCREIPFKLKWIKTFSLPLLCWLLENHFDINGLIEKGLAKDATGLNIY